MYPLDLCVRIASVGTHALTAHHRPPSPSPPLPGGRFACRYYPASRPPALPYLYCKHVLGFFRFYSPCLLDMCAESTTAQRGRLFAFRSIGNQQ